MGFSKSHGALFAWKAIVPTFLKGGMNPLREKGNAQKIEGRVKYLQLKILALLS